jgi:hypothetical protein
VNPAAGGGPKAIQNIEKRQRPQGEGQNHDEIVECRQHGYVSGFARLASSGMILDSFGDFGASLQQI